MIPLRTLGTMIPWRFVWLLIGLKDTNGKSSVLDLKPWKFSLRKWENPLNQSKNHGKSSIPWVLPSFPSPFDHLQGDGGHCGFLLHLRWDRCRWTKETWSRKNIFKIKHDSNVHQSNIYVHYIFTCSFLFSYVLRCCSSLFIHKIVDFSN